jgi:uncharacterized protein YlzI (FlbEa/FlbD family)
MAFATFADVDGRNIVVNADHVVFADVISASEVQLHLSGGEVVVIRDTLDAVIRKLTGQLPLS